MQRGMKREAEDDMQSFAMINYGAPIPLPPMEQSYMNTGHGFGGAPASTSWPLVDNKSKGTNSGNSSAAKKAKKKRSRWGTEDTKTIIPGMPTVLPPDMSKDQEEQYILHLQIEEISRKLRTGDLGIPPNPEERSPSPEPIYNNEGKRLNTREYRTRKRLEEDRHSLITRACEINTDYKPPADYKPPVIRVSDKVMIPQEEHPDINFVGLLIGPRGNTLKKLEKEVAGAKIIIRGKGSVKEGKIGRKDGQPLPGEDEPLHAFVTASNPESVKKAVDKIKEIIKQGIEVPEGQNDLRREQLRELALLNGTLRENDSLSKLRQLQQAQTIVTNTILCTICGGAGHLAQDCKQKRPGDSFRNMHQNPPQTSADKAKMDSEYMSLMAELGQGPPPPAAKPEPVHRQPPPQPYNPPPSRFGSGPPPNNSVPPPLMSQPVAPPWQNQPPQQSKVPPLMGPSSSQPPLPPWQNMNNNHSSNSSQMDHPPMGRNFGGPPPPMLSAPPPPPPSSTNSGPMPWHPPGPGGHQSKFGPPPSSSNNIPPWQQHQNNYSHPNFSQPPPWQGGGHGGPGPVPAPGPVAPPPPPPPVSHSGFNPQAPPPPPPGGSFGVPSLLGPPPPPPHP